MPPINPKEKITKKLKRAMVRAASADIPTRVKKYILLASLNPRPAIETGSADIVETMGTKIKK